MAEDFSALLKEFENSPDKINVESLTPEEVELLLKKCNPYGYVDNDAKDQKQKAAFLSITHLREQYIQRFTMTGLVGFLFAVLKEHTPKAETLRWEPRTKKPERATDLEAPDKPFDMDDTIKKLEKTLALAKSVKEEHQELKLIRNQMQEEMAASGGKLTEHYKTLLLAEKTRNIRAKTAEYLTTYETRLLGIAADRDMDETLEQLKKLPEHAETLEKFPPRAISWYPRNHTLQCPDHVAYQIVKEFLSKWLEYDPDVHVKSGHNANSVAKTLSEDKKKDSADPERPTLETIRQKPDVKPEDKDLYRVLTSDKKTQDSVMHVMHDSTLRYVLAKLLQSPDDTNRFKMYLSHVSPADELRAAIDIIPPQDTFHRWQYYMDVNYEKIRSIIESIYGVKPDLEDAVFFHKQVEGTEDEIEKERNEFKMKHHNDLNTDVLSIFGGKWTLIGSFSQNRDRIDFYNKNTEVIKRIMDRITEDQKIGKELMKDRIVKLKAQNISKDGPDAPGLVQYKNQNSELLALGAQKALSHEDMLRLNKAKGDIKAAKELEYLDQKLARENEINEIKKNRPLKKEEENELKQLVEDIKRAREQLEVPENMLQIDVFSHDAKTGDFQKNIMYTPAEAPDEKSIKKMHSEMVQQSGLGLLPGPHQALIDKKGV